MSTKNNAKVAEYYSDYQTKVATTVCQILSSLLIFSDQDLKNKHWKPKLLKVSFSAEHENWPYAMDLKFLNTVQ